MRTLRVPIAIVGAGPVGMVLAAELGMRQVNCLLLEEKTEISRHPRANTHNARSMEIYRRLGLSGALRNLGLPKGYPTDAVFATRFLAHELWRVKLPSNDELLASAEAGDPVWPTPEPQIRCSQWHLDSLLQRRLQQLPTVRVERGWKVTKAELRDDGNTLKAVNSNGETLTVEADYVVGCDGARSLVRQACGIRFEGEGGASFAFMGGQMVATHFRAPGMYAALGSMKPAWQYWSITPSQRSLMVALNGVDEFLLHTQLEPGETAQDIDIPEKLRQAVGRDVPHEILASSPWRAGQALVAQAYVKRRAAIAGDAAHLFTPTGGFGLNTGVEDAVNLAWKLAALVQGWDGSGLLQSYEDERKPVAQRNTAYALGLARMHHLLPTSPHLMDDTPAGDAARLAISEHVAKFGAMEYVTPGVQLGARYDGSSLILADGGRAPPDSPITYIPSGVPGGRFPHLWLAEGESIFDLLGEDFSLVCVCGKSPSADEAAMAQAAGALASVPLKVVSAVSAEGFTSYGARWVLVRPDQYIAWRGESLAELAALLLKACGRAALQADPPFFPTTATEETL